MSLGTSVARMMGEGEKEEEEDVEYKEEQELFEVEVVVMSLGSSDLLHKPSFLSTALKISAATPPFSHIFIIGIPYSNKDMKKEHNAALKFSLISETQSFLTLIDLSSQSIQ